MLLVQYLKIDIVTIEEYRKLLNPSMDRVIALMMKSEAKHGEGITLDPVHDQLKAIGHAVSSELGKHNPDGESHAVAALSRQFKVVMDELRQDRF